MPEELSQEQALLEMSAIINRANTELVEAVQAVIGRFPATQVVALVVSATLVRVAARLSKENGVSALRFAQVLERVLSKEFDERSVDERIAAAAPMEPGIDPSSILHSDETFSEKNGRLIVLTGRER